jgi:hypothetical protein
MILSKFDFTFYGFVIAYGFGISCFILIVGWANLGYFLNAHLQASLELGIAFDWFGAVTMQNFFNAIIASIPMIAFLIGSIHLKHNWQNCRNHLFTL